MSRFLVFGWLVPLVMLVGAGCKKAGAGEAADGAADGSTEHGAVACAAIDAGEADDAAGSTSTTDEFGPNAPVAKATSSLGRVNVFEVTTPSTLERVDIYLRADLDGSRVTIAVQEATSRTSDFQKLTEVQLDIGTCEGWITSGALAIPLVVGRFYAIGYDPNQIVLPFVSTDVNVLPIDGAFGRLIGSKTTTSVSVSSLGWDKVISTEFNRQRLVTAPRAAGPADTDAGSDADASAPADADADGGTSADAGRDGGASPG